MARDLLVKIQRTQECEICVRVDDAVQYAGVYRMNASELLKGLIGVDWESQDSWVDEVTSDIDDPDSYPRVNLSAEP
jgi:hypothetical protein